MPVESRNIINELLYKTHLIRNPFDIKVCPLEDLQWVHHAESCGDKGVVYVVPCIRGKQYSYDRNDPKSLEEFLLLRSVHPVLLVKV